MLHSYKFIYENMAYVTFHGVISTDYPDLENQARASYNNAISWKDLNAQENAQLKMALNKVVSTKNVATLPLLSDATAEIVNGGFVVTGKCGADTIKIDGIKLYKNGERLWPEGDFEEEEEPAQEPVEEEPVAEEPVEEVPAVEAEKPLVAVTKVEGGALIEDNRPVTIIEADSRVGISVNKPVAPFDPTVDFPKTTVGFVYGKSMKQPERKASFELGFVPGEHRPEGGQATVFGSTEMHFVWCEEYAKTHKPTWNVPIAVSGESTVTAAEEHKEAPVEEDAFEDIFGENSGSEEVVVAQEQDITYTTDSEYTSKNEPTSAKINYAMDETRSASTRSWDTLLSDKQDIDENSKYFTPTAPVKEKLRSSIKRGEKGAVVEVPDFMLEVPRELLGNINAYTTGDVDKEMLVANGSSYCIQNGWANVGQWYCIDVVSTASRFFFNDVTGICEEVTFSMCKETLKQIEG